MLSDLQNRPLIDSTRYSGIITVNDKDFLKVRDVLVNAIKEIRKIVEKSVPDHPHILSLDCYKL